MVVQPDLEVAAEKRPLTRLRTDSPLPEACTFRQTSLSGLASCATPTGTRSIWTKGFGPFRPRGWSCARPITCRSRDSPPNCCSGFTRSADRPVTSWRKMPSGSAPTPRGHARGFGRRHVAPSGRRTIASHLDMAHQFKSVSGEQHHSDEPNERAEL